MALSEAARELRKKPCTCGKNVRHYGPHTAECPRYIDRSRSKEIIEALIEKRHNESEGEWISLREFHRIDLFVMRLWGEWPDAKQAKRWGLPMHRSFHRRVAYEVKISRSDFRSEIRNPAKRAEAMALCHQWFFATPPGLVRRDEIPEDCGLVEVSPDGTVKVVRHAPIRKPSKSLNMGDVVALLRARHAGPSFRQVREAARVAVGKLKAAESEYARAQGLLALARVRLIREKGHLLEAGSEWVGPRSALPAYERRQVKGDEVRVVVTSVGMYDDYDETHEDYTFGRSGTIYFKPVEIVESSGDYYGGAWLDAGDFLIAFRHDKEPAKVAPPPRSSLHSRKRPKLVAVDGQALDDDIEF